jgi:hypothetical protein
MKLSRTLLILMASATVVFARAIAVYDNAKPPAMSLPAGYDLAVKALGSSTNQFHCISAGLGGSGTSTVIDGPVWLFTFCSTNIPQKHKWVAVGFGGKTDVEDEHSLTYPE